MRRFWVVLAALALLMTFPSPMTTPVVLAATDAGSCGTFSQTTPGEYTCTVPAGVSELAFEVRAGNGGRGYGLSTPTPGGQGAKIGGSIAVTAGETLYITVGSNGWGWDNYPAKNNGGGGGYSSVARMIDLVLTPLVVAGGGGGAGTADQNARPYAGGAGGDGGTTVTTRGGGAGGSTGTSSSSASNGEAGGTTSIGGTAGTAYGFAGGDAGVNGNRLITDTWLLGDARPGAGGGGFGAIGGYGNPNKWVPAGTPRSAPYTGAFGAGGEGSTDGGGGGGGGYAGGGGGGAGTVYDSTGGGGGGSSLVPDGATAAIEPGSPHVTLTGLDTTSPTITGSAKVKGTSVTVTWAVSETATVACWADDVSLSIDCGSPLTGQYAKGLHHVDLQATDAAGNTSDIVTVSFTIKSGKQIKPS